MATRIYVDYVRDGLVAQLAEHLMNLKLYSVEWCEVLQILETVAPDEVDEMVRDCRQLAQMMREEPSHEYKPVNVARMVG
jgi:hypothetical protein